jgi:GH15 family glucan-1,4-alpha-glucosidase
MTDVHQVAIPHALREYAFVADGERGALIGPQGNYAWMCFPSWDSPAVFTSLLGGHGDFQIAPADDRHVWGGYYEPRSLIWRSRWITGHTVVECRQALARPATPDRAVVLCRIESKRGQARVRATLDLRANFGRRAMMTQVSRDDGVWSMRSGDVHARWAGAAGARHRTPEAGIWEIENRVWTHSRLTCVAGLRNAAALLAAPPEMGEWLALADSILAETTRSSLSPAGNWRRATDDDRIDASLLIPPIRGALAADDPRTVATLTAVNDRLVDDGFVYRYRIDEAPLGSSEGAFMLCGFFLALAGHQQGLRTEALRCFERTRSGCGTSGLFTEEYDVAQRQLRANIPQAFVHAALLETAARLMPSLQDGDVLDRSPGWE